MGNCLFTRDGFFDPFDHYTDALIDSPEVRYRELYWEETPYDMYNHPWHYPSVDALCIQTTTGDFVPLHRAVALLSTRLNDTEHPLSRPVQATVVQRRRLLQAHLSYLYAHQKRSQA